MSSSVKCSDCGKELMVGDYPFCPHLPFRQAPVNCHPSETCVLWQNPKTGETRWPGRNDRDMPALYKSAGFERVEHRSIHNLKAIEKTHGVHSEVLHFDRGTGRGFGD